MRVPCVALLVVAISALVAPTKAEAALRGSLERLPEGHERLARRGSTAAVPAPGAARLPMPTNAACFFESPSFKGAFTCLPVGDHATLPSGWNDRATAVLLAPDVVVDLFENAALAGQTATVFATESNLGRVNMSARTSSVRIRALAPARASAIPRSQAARFLMQASYGPTWSEIDRVATIGADAWLQEQFNTAPRDSHWTYVVERKGPIGCNPCQSQYINATMESFWDQAVRGPDQLRQRTAFALSQIFVVSTVNSAVEIQADAHASYLDTLSRNAFGNYRQLLEEVTLHPTMAHYLSHFRNEKEDPVTGRIPDENYAREVMQLFSIGLWELNPDGTRRKDAQGRDIPSYGQDDVMGLARVLTGWSWAGANTNDEYWHGWAGNGGGASWNKPMQLYPQFHSTSEKRFLGVVIPPNTNGRESLRIALDRLHNHPNTGPFMAEQLIKRFVTSNPSPAYVGRVAAAFADNGRGVRGDMQAVIRAVLLDNEASRPDQRNAETSGRLREPMVRFGHWMRAFNARAANDTFEIWNLEDPVSSIGQNPLRSPSVFNWYRPGYAPPGDIQQRGMVAPEFQITHETTVTGYANFVVNVVERGFGWNAGAIRADYSAELALAATPAALVDRVNLLLTAGRLSGTNRQLIIEAVSAVPASNAATRVHTAVALTMLSPDYQVQK
jgi:uncharacterized protein (DUF1800 family)